MRSSTSQRWNATCRFGHFAQAGARVQRRAASEVRETLTAGRPVEVVEFVTPGGEVVGRRVRVGDQSEHWLRPDLDDLAAESLRDEAELYARIAAEVVGVSREADQRRADAAGLSLEQFRSKRNHTLARIDQRRGKSSIGM